MQSMLSLKDVAGFHRDSQAIKKLTPPPIRIQIHTAEPLSEGSRSEFTMWFGPFPIQWLAVHSEVDPDGGFTDSQHKGPMKYWEHSHRFFSGNNDTSLIVEKIKYEHHPGLKGIVTRLLFSTPSLKWLFYYRKIALNRIFARIRRPSSPSSPINQSAK